MNIQAKGLSLIRRTADLFDQMCEKIDGTELFKDLEWESMRILGSYMEAYKADPESVIFREGDEGAFACLILEGTVEIFKEDPQHERIAVITLSPGQFFGEMAVIDEEPRSGTAIVRERAMLAVLTREKFAKLLEKYPLIGINVLRKLARLLSQRLRRTSGMLVEHLHPWP